MGKGKCSPTYVFSGAWSEGLTTDFTDFRDMRQLNFETLSQNLTDQPRVREQRIRLIRANLCEPPYHYKKKFRISDKILRTAYRDDVFLG